MVDEVKSSGNLFDNFWSTTKQSQVQATYQIVESKVLVKNLEHIVTLHVGLIFGAFLSGIFKNVAENQDI